MTVFGDDNTYAVNSAPIGNSVALCQVFTATCHNQFDNAVTALGTVTGVSPLVGFGVYQVTSLATPISGTRVCSSNCDAITSNTQNSITLNGPCNFFPGTYAVCSTFANTATLQMQYVTGGATLFTFPLASACTFPSTIPAGGTLLTGHSLDLYVVTD